MRKVQVILVWQLVICAVASQACGQVRRPSVKMKTLRSAGTIQGARQRLLQLKLDDGRTWLVSIPKEQQHLIYQAQATPAWLQPGMTVRFEAPVRVEKRMREVEIAEPLATLTIAPVRPDVGMGLFPESNSRNSDAALADVSAANKDRSASVVPCLIVGVLREYQEGKMQIDAGRIRVRCQLAPKAEIPVELHDLTWARPGDKVNVTARYPEGRPGQAEGQQITITAAALLDRQPQVKPSRRKAQQ